MPVRTGKPGRPRELVVGVLRKDPPNDDGIRVLLVEVRDDKRGAITRWLVRATEDGRIVGQVLPEQHEIYRVHRVVVRRDVGRTVRAAVRQQELFEQAEAARGE